VDHFSFTTNATFQLRYLVNATHWRKHEGKPIFFYTGNEGDIEMFAQNTVRKALNGVQPDGGSLY
jgi:lysosomal Pro-X carboxypeptidase